MPHTALHKSEAADEHFKNAIKAKQKAADARNELRDSKGFIGIETGGRLRRTARANDLLAVREMSSHNQAKRNK